MLNVFASGSCRLLENIDTGHNQINPIHSLFCRQSYDEYNGINFMGKLHNTKQHIAFLKLLRNEINIPHHILSLFLHTYFINDPSVKEKLSKLRDNFKNCDVFIFEICSTKLYQKDGWPLLQEQWIEKLYEKDECPPILEWFKAHHIDIIHQTEEDIFNDMNIIRSLIPPNKHLVFQCHFRLGYIYNKDVIIESRELVYNLINKFISKNKNTYIYDPSILLRSKPEYLNNDNMHFNYDKYKNEIFEDLMNLLSKCSNT